MFLTRLYFRQGKWLGASKGKSRPCAD